MVGKWRCQSMPPPGRKEYRNGTVQWRSETEQKTGARKRSFSCSQIKA